MKVRREQRVQGDTGMESTVPRCFPVLYIARRAVGDPRSARLPFGLAGSTDRTGAAAFAELK